jgi:hypothetical protein
VAGKCIHCGKVTRNKIGFIDERGKRVTYHSCMLGECATKSIDQAFVKEESINSQDLPGWPEGLDFQIPENVRALFG